MTLVIILEPRTGQFYKWTSTVLPFCLAPPAIDTRWNIWQVLTQHPQLFYSVIKLGDMREL